MDAPDYTALEQHVRQLSGITDPAKRSPLSALHSVPLNPGAATVAVVYEDQQERFTFMVLKYYPIAERGTYGTGPAPGQPQFITFDDIGPATFPTYQQALRAFADHMGEQADSSPY